MKVKKAVMDKCMTHVDARMNVELVIGPVRWVGKLG